MKVYEYDFFGDGTTHRNIGEILSVSTDTRYNCALKWSEYGFFYPIGSIGSPEEKHQIGNIRHIRLWSFKKLNIRQEEVLFREIGE